MIVKENATSQNVHHCHVRKVNFVWFSTVMSEQVDANDTRNALISYSHA